MASLTIRNALVWILVKSGLQFSNSAVKKKNPAGTPYSLRSLAKIISNVTRHFPLGTRKGEERGWRVTVCGF